MTGTHDLVVIANRPHHHGGHAIAGPDDALRAIVRDRDGIWISGADSAESPAGAHLDRDGVRIHPVPPASGPLDHSAAAQSAASIWPTYHDAVRPPVFRPDWRLGYRDVNSRFARAGAGLAAPSATVWIEGHDLQLVPALLRALRPDTRIGFFLPIPFPPIELFMRMPDRDEILRGLLGADAIGLQTPGDVDNLLHAVRHLLGVPVDGGQIILPDRRTTVAAVPASVNTGDIARRACDPAVLAQSCQLRAHLGDPRLLILSVDQLDHAAGIEQRLLAIEQLIAERRLRPRHAAVVQIALPARHPTPSDDDLRHRVEQLVARINGDHGRVGRAAVHYLYREVAPDDLIALYLAADLLLATPLRDGMNLTAKQYLAARHDESGALILSEFSGAAPELRAAHLVNPYDLDQLKTTILHAATEQPHRAAHRLRTMRRHLHHHDAHAWAARLLSTLDIRLGSAGHTPSVRTLAPT